MLVGKVTYKTSDKKYKFDIKAVDSSSSFQAKLYSSDYSAVDLMSGAADENNLETRRFDVSMTNVKVETKFKQELQPNGKTKRVPCPVNFDFFCRLASLIRYAKSQCKASNEEGYTGLSSASGEVDFVSEHNYIIPFPIPKAGGTPLAKVTLALSEIKNLTLKTDDFEIELSESTVADPEIFYSIKNSKPKGFRFTEEYLGIPFPKQEVNTLGYLSSSGLYRDLAEVIAAHPDKEFEWLREKDYRLVTDETLKETCNYIMAHEGYVYYDTETTGLDINFKSRIGQADQLVGVVLSVKDGESFYFPCQMKCIPNLCDGDHWYFMEHYMKPILEGKELVAHNMSFDWKVSYIYGINANIVHDTMALIKLTLGAEKPDFPMGLKELAKILLHRDSLELSDLVTDDSWGDSDIKFWDLPAELVRLYANADTDNTRGLLDYAIKADLLQRYNAKRVYEIEIAFSYAVAYQEFYGHKINTEKVDQIRAKTMAENEQLLAKMVEIVGHDFNPSSSPQLQQVMYKELGIPEQISRKTGRVTTDKDTLNALAEITDINGEPKYPFVVLLQEYRKNDGVLKIIKQFPETATEDGYIFSEVQQYGTTTGRVAIKKPNYQSYSDAVKKEIVPRPGFYMTDTDYSSVEYRVLGSMADNKMIKEGFVDPDFDYHAYQASRMYNVPYASVTKKLRKAAKGINFGLPYGMGDASLGVRIFGEETPENTIKAAELRRKYFEGQEDIRDFFENARDKGVSLGYTETFFGRRRYYNRAKFSIPAIRRQAGNQVIQGCLDGDTLIQTRDFGIQKIKDIVGYNLDVWDGEQWTRGDITYSGKKRKCIVKFNGGMEMVCSPIHKFLVRSHHGNDRFVDCKDLATKETHRNPHRVVVCQYHADSEHTYKSDRSHSEWYGTAHNANNVFLDDIGDSFDEGVVLGRLASDGSLSLDRGYITQFVAEHEMDVFDYLKDAMSPLNCTSVIKPLREGRNQRMANVTVHSKTLANEIADLDIRHKIDSRIFADTEMLRGFLRGMFDGDGGVSGRTITLVQGTQDDFEPLMKDIQKALLFFGIRSRYRKYDDRLVLQIKTTDNDLFLDTIGFINEDKQHKGMQLRCKEDEHIFGRCLVVESVEITDEWIDMYDVCNTERGYYVANGVITHNTAADIYKLAVGRVFKRVCKEGWLGKVMLTGFIHDELLAEVHNSINPAVWLKALREEFEVSIKGWCPLYMGFGYGMSWYEAKSVELPIKFQWEIVSKYGETGFPDWDGNGEALCAKVPDMLRDFSIRDIAEQLQEAEHQGEVIKPTLNNALLDAVKEDVSIYNGVLAKDIPTEEMLSELSKNHIQFLKRDEDGNIVTELKKPEGTQEAIDLFCTLHGVVRSNVNLLDIPDATTKDTEGGSKTIVSSGLLMDDEESEEHKRRMFDARVDNLGICVNFDEGIAYLLKLDDNVMRMLLPHLNDIGEGYPVRLKDNEAHKLYNTTKFISSSEVDRVRDFYLHYFSDMQRLQRQVR